MAILAIGHKMLNELCDAIGLGKSVPVQRIVICADVHDAVRVYVKMLLDESRGSGKTVSGIIKENVGDVQVAIVKDISIDEQTGDVRVMLADEPTTVSRKERTND